MLRFELKATAGAASLPFNGVVAILEVEVAGARADDDQLEGIQLVGLLAVIAYILPGGDKCGIPVNRATPISHLAGETGPGIHIREKRRENGLANGVQQLRCIGALWAAEGRVAVIIQIQAVVELRPEADFEVTERGIDRTVVIARQRAGVEARSQVR